MIPAFIKDRLNQWWTLPAQLTRIERLIQTTLERINIMANTVADVLAKVADLKAQVGSIGDQIVAKITDLQAKIDAGQDTSAELAALNNLGTTLQAVDDLVPDLPKTPPAE